MVEMSAIEPGSSPFQLCRNHLTKISTSSGKFETASIAQLCPFIAGNFLLRESGIDNTSKDDRCPEMASGASEERHEIYRFAEFGVVSMRSLKRRSTSVEEGEVLITHMVVE